MLRLGGGVSIPVRARARVPGGGSLPPGLFPAPHLPTPGRARAASTYVAASRVALGVGLAAGAHAHGRPTSRARPARTPIKTNVETDAKPTEIKII